MLEYMTLKDMIKLPREFNWVAILKDLAHGAPITHEEHVKLVIMAAGWPTCACGQLCVNLPRSSDRSPSDHRLHTYGVQFYEHVEEQDWVNALTTFYKIEKRTMQLLEDQ